MSSSRIAVLVPLLLTVACAHDDDGSSPDATSNADELTAAADGSFGTSGTVTHALPFEQVASIREVADGKVLIVSCDALVRLDADGSLDTTFGEGGIATLPDHVGCASVAERTTGGFVAAGGGAGSVTVVHLDADGHADATFGVDGTLRFIPLQFGMSLSDVVVSATPSADVFVFSRGSRSIARVFADGKVDATFGERGRVAVPDQSMALGAEYTMFTASKDRLYFSDDYWLSAEHRGLAIRAYDFAGALDPSFGEEGVVLREYDPQASYAWYASELLPLAGGGLAVVVVTPDAHPYAVRELLAFDSHGAIDTRMFGESAGVLHEGGWSTNHVVADSSYRSDVLVFYPGSTSFPGLGWFFDQAGSGSAFDLAAYRGRGATGLLQALGFGRRATYAVAAASRVAGDAPLADGFRRFAVTKLRR